MDMLLLQMGHTNEMAKVKALLALVEEENKRLHSYICNNTLPDPSRPAPPFRMPFAGEGKFFTPDSVLSHCFGALLPMFTTKEANTLRQLCREFKSTVADFPWEDEKTLIRGRVAAWRACFPKARWANVRQLDGGRRAPVVDADFVHFVGLRRLNMRGCRIITDAAFVHLKGIHTLDMSYCSQPTITEAAFAHLKGIHTLNMTACNQATITDAAFLHFKGIHTLNMTACNQATITDAAFVHLKGIHTLEMANCLQLTITDAAFIHLKGIHSLSFFSCTQLTSAVFSYLTGVKVLDLGRCPQLIPTDALRGVELLGLFGCPESTQDVVASLGIPFVLGSITIA